MEAKNILEVERFVVECNDMLKGKFFDLNKRLEKFLSVMTESEDLLDFLGDCLDDFDEDVEFNQAFNLDRKTGNIKVAIPVDDKKKVALFVTIFNNLTNNTLNVNQFLETFFQDKKNNTVQNFLEKIIKPYKEVICKFFEINPNITFDDIKRQVEQQEKSKKQEEKENEKDALPHIEELMAEIVKNCNQILSMLKFEKKHNEICDDVEFIVNAILSECEKNDLMVVNALVIGLIHTSRKLHSIKSFVTEIDNLILNYYDFISSDAKKEKTVEENENEDGEEKAE